MRILQFLLIFCSLLLTQLSVAQNVPLSYSYTGQSPKFEPTGNVISIYQEENFAILQTHPANQTPDFTPVNHWDYNLNGSFCKDQFVVLREVGKQQYLVEEEKVRTFTDAITFDRKGGGQELYQIKYSDLRITISPWEKDTLVLGLTTRSSTLTAQINATITGSQGEILHQLNGVFEHHIWISPDLPFSSIAYNLLINTDAPPLFIEPENFTITNERPWLSIGDKIYGQLSRELEKKGMIVQMISKYKYLKSDGSEHQQESGNLTLKEINSPNTIVFQPTNYPVLSEELFEKIYDASRYAQVKEAELPAEGALSLSLKNYGDYEGRVFFQSTRQFFALQAQTHNASGDTLKLVLLKISPDLPTQGPQDLSDLPISSIRKQMEQGPPDGFMQQFFVSGTMKHDNDLIYFLYPAEGSLTFDQVSDEMISGVFALNLEAAEVKNLQVKQTLESLNGEFKAVKLN